MKIEPRQVEAFLKKPDPKIRGVVIYGNDDGLIAERALEECNIIVNKNKIPGDKHPALITSGMRLGTNSLALRGLTAEEMPHCAGLIHKVLGSLKVMGKTEYELADAVKKYVRVEVQKPVPVTYRGLVIRDAFRADLVVEERLVIEVKSVERLAPVHAKQLLTYLRLMDQPLGLLMNFGADMFRNGVKRVINNRSDFAGRFTSSSSLPGGS